MRTQVRSAYVAVVLLILLALIISVMLCVSAMKYENAREISKSVQLLSSVSNVDMTSVRGVSANSKPVRVYAESETTKYSRVREFGENVYVIDKTQNALLWGTRKALESGQVQRINSRMEDDTSKPYMGLLDVTILQNGEIFLIDSKADGIFEYTPDGDFARDHRRFEGGSAIVNCICITSDYNDVVYVLQQTSDGFNILNLTPQDERAFSVLKTVSADDLSSVAATTSKNALLACDFEGTAFFIATNGQLLKVTQEGVAIVCSYEGSALDIAVDYRGTPYLALNNGKIMKCEAGVTFLELDCATFTFNLETGVITYFDASNELKVYENNFVNNLSNFVHPVDYALSTNLATSAKIFEVTSDTDAFKYPIKVASREAVESGTKVILLAEVDDFADYYYVLISKNTLTPCYMLKANLLALEATTLDTQLRTYTTNARLFKYPTADYVEGTESLYLTKVPAGTNLKVVSDVCRFKDSQDREFYEVIYEDEIYYVMASMLTTLATEEGAVTLKPSNASLSGKEGTRVYAGLNSDIVVGTIPTGASFWVNVSTFNKKASRTYVEYLDEENNYICGFIDTKRIALKDMNPFIIVGIFLVLLALILILILVLYFIKEHKKKKV